jgi:hypothetical protein
MSETYRVTVHGRPDIRELSFEIPPSVGDPVRLPDLDGDLHMKVQEVVHYARNPHSNQLASTTIHIVPQGTRR